MDLMYTQFLWYEVIELVLEVRITNLPLQAGSHGSKRPHYSYQ